MKTLFILRHAKSSWKDETLPDFERPLNSRGRKAAELIGSVFQEEKVQPDLVVSSSALRARETLDIIMRTNKLRFEVRYDERIYEAGVARLLSVINEVEKNVRSVLIVGHNPGMEELVTALTGKVEMMPTAALAKISFKASNWNTIKGGTLDWIVRPKEWVKR